MKSLGVSEQIPDILRSLKEPFGCNSVKISDCQAFSLFETVPGCRAFGHSEIKGNKLFIQALNFMAGLKVEKNFYETENCNFDGKPVRQRLNAGSD